MKQRSEERVEVTIGVKPHLAKYIQGHLAQQDGRLYVDANSALGTFFFGMVEKGLPPKGPPPAYSITIMLPNRDELGGLYDARYEGIHVNDANCQRINEFLDFIFRKELFSRLDMLQERGEANRKSGKMKTEMLNYLERYNIDFEQISYEALKKSYYRYQKSGRLLIEQVL